VNNFEFKSIDDLEKNIKQSNHLRLEKIKNCFVNILRCIMWLISLAFTGYIIRFLYLTAFDIGSNEIVVNRMQDIIVKVSGWVLFVLSQAGIIRRSNKKESRE